MRELDKKTEIAQQAKVDSGKIGHKEQRAQLRDLEKAVNKARRQADKAEEAYGSLQEKLDVMDKVLADAEAYKKASSDPAYYLYYEVLQGKFEEAFATCPLYPSPSPRDRQKARMSSSAWKKKKKQY